MPDRVGWLLDEASRAGPDLEFEGLLQGHDMLSKPLAMRALTLCFLFHVSIVRGATKTLQRDLLVMILYLRTLSL